MFDRTSPIFTQPEIAKVTGLPAEVITAWIRRDLVHTSFRPEAGKRKARFFSAQDALLFASMAELTRLGVSVGSESVEAAKDIAAGGEGFHLKSAGAASLWGSSSAEVMADRRFVVIFQDGDGEITSEAVADPGMAFKEWEGTRADGDPNRGNGYGLTAAIIIDTHALADRVHRGLMAALAAREGITQKGN